MDAAVDDYNEKYNKIEIKSLANIIEAELSDAESKIWHVHPVCFIKGNPIVGYSVVKEEVPLLFWSGQSLEEKKLSSEGKFKVAGIRYTEAAQINLIDLKRWLKKA